MHDAEVAVGDEGVRVQHGHRRLGGHAGVGDGQVALPVPHPVAGAGVGGPARVLEHAEVPARAEHAHLGPVLGQRGLDPLERRLGHVEHGAGTEALHVGAAGTQIEQGAADRHPVHRHVGAERQAHGGIVRPGPGGVVGVEGDARGVRAPLVEGLEHGDEQRAQLRLEGGVAEEEPDHSAHGQAAPTATGRR